MRDKWIKWSERAPTPADNAEVLVYWEPDEEPGEELFSVAICDERGGGSFSWRFRGGGCFLHEGPHSYPYHERPTHWQPLEGPA
jgi:hypothetical protein